MPLLCFLKDANRLVSHAAKTAACLAGIVLLAAVFVPAASAGDGAEAPKTGLSGHCVVLLHGLARTSRSMEPVAEALADAGAFPVNIDYPSTEKPIEALAMKAVADGIRQCRQAGSSKVHFVTHSMGALLLRYYLSRRRVPELGRAVMLAPPNQGSKLADRLRDMEIYRWYNGPAGQQLGTGKDGIAARLPPVDYPLGVIAGHDPYFFDAPFSKMIPGEDDGKVAVSRTRVEGMADFLSLPYGHTFIMEADEVLFQVRYFLEHGAFRKDGSTDGG